jgi:histidinol-phosphate phosphatase family protein
VNGSWSISDRNGPLRFEPAGRPNEDPGRPVAFLDRDGVLNDGVPDLDTGMCESPLRVEDVRLLPGAATAAGALAAAGYSLVCVSNQPAAAKGKVSVGELLAVHERVAELLAGAGVCLDASLLCPHHPQGVVAELSVTCDCRKPAAGMLLDIAGRRGADLGACWMLGDTDADVRAGKVVGCRTVLIEYPGSAHKRSGELRPDLLAADLADGVARLFQSQRGPTVGHYPARP